MGTGLPPPGPNSLPKMYCKRCGYVLSGLPRRHKEFGAEDIRLEAVASCFMKPQRCPECGRRFDPKDATSYDSHPKVVEWQRRKRLALWIAATGLVLFAIGGALYLWHADKQQVRLRLNNIGFSYTTTAGVIGDTVDTIDGSSATDENLVVVARCTKLQSLG